jgi:tetratricopeptide (TPR) repeat protein
VLLPDLVHAHYFLGAAYLARCESCPGEYQVTVDHLLQATRVDPNWQPSWFALARVALFNGNYDCAQQFAERLLSVGAEDTGGTRFIGAETILGTVWLRREGLALAESWFQRGMEILSGSDHMYRDDMRAANACGLADAKMHRDKPSEALIDYRRAWHIVQEYPRMLTRERAGVRALAGLASAYAAQGETKQARKLLAQAIESVDRCADGTTTNPVVPLPDLYLVLASSYARLEEHTLAVHMLERAFNVGWRDAEWLKREPQLRLLSDDPRFMDILRAVQQFPPVHFDLTSAEGRKPARGHR